MDCLRFVAVQAVTGALRQDERHAVQFLVTQGTPEAGGVELAVQRPKDLLLDRKVAVSTLGESLLQTSQDYLPPHPGRNNKPSSQKGRQISHPGQRSSSRPAQLHTESIWSSEGEIVCPPPGDRPLLYTPGTHCIYWGRTGNSDYLIDLTSKTVFTSLCWGQ